MGMLGILGEHQGCGTYRGFESIDCDMAEMSPLEGGIPVELLGG